MGRSDVERAYGCFDKALSSDPDDVLALSDMADLMLLRKANPQDALNYAQRAGSKSPPFYQPYLWDHIAIKFEDALKSRIQSAII